LAYQSIETVKQQPEHSFLIRKSGQVETWPTWLEAIPLQLLLV